MGTLTIRKAEQKDLEAVLAIYNDEVVNGISNLDIHPKTPEQGREWFSRYNKENHPLLVAEAEDGHIAGYASLGRFREKEAYCSTVELSVYVARQDREHGVATQLLKEILEEARRDPRTHLVVSVITSVNRASIELHKKFGFVFCGRFHEVGTKLGHYVDIDNYELRV